MEWAVRDFQEHLYNETLQRNIVSGQNPTFNHILQARMAKKQRAAAEKQLKLVGEKVPCRREMGNAVWDAVMVPAS